MAQKIISVSISKLEDEFMAENNISPTRLIRNKVQEMIEFQRNRGSPDLIKELNNKIENWKEIAEKQRDFITEKGLIDEFVQ